MSSLSKPDDVISGFILEDSQVDWSFKEYVEVTVVT